MGVRCHARADVDGLLNVSVVLQKVVVDDLFEFVVIARAAERKC